MIILRKREIERKDVRYYLIELKGKQTHATDEEIAFKSTEMLVKLLLTDLEKDFIFYVGDVHLDLEKEGSKAFDTSEYSVSVKTYFAVPLFINIASFGNLFRRRAQTYQLEISKTEIFNRPSHFNSPENKPPHEADVYIDEKTKNQIDALLEHVITTYRLEVLKNEIDKALDKKDKEVFHQLSKEYAFLKKRFIEKDETALTPDI